MEVFLGGTTAEGTNWRERLIPSLKCNYFNPIVDNWDEEAQELEKEKRKTCDFVLYVISPLMEGSFSIAEVVDDSNKRPEQTILCFIEEDGIEEYKEKEWTEHQKKSNESIKKLVEENGAIVLESLLEVSQFLNEIYDE